MKSSKDICYLNNSATSYPKPDSVAREIAGAITQLSEMTGRGEEATSRDRIKIARVNLARFFGCGISDRFIFTGNSTDALNMAIHGYFDCHYSGRALHVVTTTNDHNSVLRPLRTLEREGKCSLSIVPSDDVANLEAERIFDAIKPETRIVAVNHLSNVVGTIAPLAELGSVCREKGIALVVDASQSAGLLDIDADEMKIDLLAITGHKYMFGPTGIGALYIGEHVDILPRKQGGTGVKSAYALQPEDWPIHFEAGTVNYIGIVGLETARNELELRGLESVPKTTFELRRRCEAGLRSIPGVRVYGPDVDAEKGSVISFTMENHQVPEVDEILRSRFGIIVRSGLHCAPLCHETIGTAPLGTVRASFSCLTQSNAPEMLVEAIKEISSC